MVGSRPAHLTVGSPHGWDPTQTGPRAGPRVRIPSSINNLHARVCVAGGQPCHAMGSLRAASAGSTQRHRASGVRGASLARLASEAPRHLAALPALRHDPALGAPGSRDPGPHRLFHPTPQKRLRAPPPRGVTTRTAARGSCAGLAPRASRACVSPGLGPARRVPPGLGPDDTQLCTVASPPGLIPRRPKRRAALPGPPIIGGHLLLSAALRGPSRAR